MNHLRQRPYVERRGSERQSVGKAAVVQECDGNTRINCVVSNGSRSGCELLGPHVEDLSHRIRIDMDGFSKPFYGIIVRRHRGRIGVKFHWAGS